MKSSLLCSPSFFRDVVPRTSRFVLLPVVSPSPQEKCAASTVGHFVSPLRSYVSSAAAIETKTRQALVAETRMPSLVLSRFVCGHLSSDQWKGSLLSAIRAREWARGLQETLDESHSWSNATPISAQLQWQHNDRSSQSQQSPRRGWLAIFQALVAKPSSQPGQAVVLHHPVLKMLLLQVIACHVDASASCVLGGAAHLHDPVGRVLAPAWQWFVGFAFCKTLRRTLRTVFACPRNQQSMNLRPAHGAPEAQPFFRKQILLSPFLRFLLSICS